jgi:hypothetical protein
MDEIDRRTGQRRFEDGWGAFSFPFSNVADCRFIRLTQIGQTHGNSNTRTLSLVEFFGQLFES